MSSYLARDDDLSGLFEPDLLTPEQDAERRRLAEEEIPEIKLMIAVMADAVNLYQRNAACRAGRARRLFEEARLWIESTDQSWLYSFESICRVLQLEPAQVRRELRTWRLQHLRGERPAPPPRRRIVPRPKTLRSRWARQA